MPLIVWRDKLSIGVPEIDRDHQQLIKYLNDFYDAAQEGHAHKAVARTLIRLMEYTRDHFAREEKVMAAVEYPHIEAHKKAHRELTQQVKVVAARFAQNPNGSIDEEVFDFLRSWLTDHIIGMDRDIAEHTRNKRPWVDDKNIFAGVG